LCFSGPGRDPFQFCGLGTDFPFKIMSLTHNRRTILIANSLSLTHKCTILIARVHLHSAVEGPSGQGPWNKISIQDNTPKTNFLEMGE
jgi:hypothetical protein